MYLPEDHRSLGAKYDLFSFFEEAPGFPVWHENGLRIKNSLIQYWRQIHRDNGYLEMESPMMLDKELWKKSGHCDYFEENMFFSSVDKRDYAIKPMSCPGAILAFNSKRRSHAELPLRFCELGHVHRNEQSGALHGLLRVRSFVQDDAHIFCAGEDLLNEVSNIISLIQMIMQKCGLPDYHFELSVRDKRKKQYMGEDQDWKYCEDILEKALIRSKLDVHKKEGEAKFYGPSLDLHVKDRHGRSWQCSTIQLDFNLPNRFGLHYYDKEGNKRVPYMLHRAIFGSIERFIGMLLEHYGKKLPFWLHPNQYRILNVSQNSLNYARSLLIELRAKGHFVEIDQSSDPLKEKVKKAREDMVYSIIVIGDKEVEEQKYVVQVL